MVMSDITVDAWLLYARVCAAGETCRSECMLLAELGVLRRASNFARSAGVTLSGLREPVRAKIGQNSAAPPHQAYFPGFSAVRTSA